MDVRFAGLLKNFVLTMIIHAALVRSLVVSVSGEFCAIAATLPRVCLRVILN